MHASLPLISQTLTRPPLLPPLTAASPVAATAGSPVSMPPTSTAMLLRRLLHPSHNLRRGLQTLTTTTNAVAAPSSSSPYLPLTHLFTCGNPNTLLRELVNAAFRRTGGGHAGWCANCTLLLRTRTSHWESKKSVCYHMARAHFATESSDIDHPKESAEELHQKMLKSVEAQTMPPNAWLWSMISSCSSEEDIKLLFQILQKLRVFRLSNLRINANFNDHLCMKVSEACARVGVLDYGLKVLWNHNVYGITPTIGSAHYLLQHAKEHNDTKLMERIMQVLRRNSLPLQAGTADIVFSICYNADRWDLLSKYAARFVQAGVKLRRTAFDIWMEFAAKVGDSQSIWEINSLRGKSVKHYTLTTGFACAKGSLLERKPENAAATIKLLHKHLPDQKKPFVKDELQKLVAEWPTEVIKRQKKDDRKAMEEALITDIPKMISSMAKSGLDISVDLDKLTPQLEAA